MKQTTGIMVLWLLNSVRLWPQWSPNFSDTQTYQGYLYHRLFWHLVLPHRWLSSVKMCPLQGGPWSLPKALVMIMIMTMRTMTTSSQKTPGVVEMTHVLVVCKDALEYQTPQLPPLLKVIHLMCPLLLMDHRGSPTEVRRQRRLGKQNKNTQHYN